MSLEQHIAKAAVERATKKVLADLYENILAESDHYEAIAEHLFSAGYRTHLDAYLAERISEDFLSHTPILEVQRCTSGV